MLFQYRKAILGMKRLIIVFLLLVRALISTMIESFFSLNSDFPMQKHLKFSPWLSIVFRRMVPRNTLFATNITPCAFFIQWFGLGKVIFPFRIGKSRIYIRFWRLSSGKRNKSDRRERLCRIAA